MGKILILVHCRDLLAPQWQQKRQHLHFPIPLSSSLPLAYQGRFFAFYSPQKLSLASRSRDSMILKKGVEINLPLSI